MTFGIIVMTLFFTMTLSLFYYIILWYRKEQKKTLNFILQKLDAAIGGKIHENKYDESIDAAITEKLNQLVERLEINHDTAVQERNRVKSLVSDISHQVRMPLSNIILYAGLLKEARLEEESMKMVEQINRQSEKLDFFMKELVRSSYLESDMISINTCLQPMDELIERACQVIEMQSIKKKIMIEKEVCTATCIFDMKWTVEALVNILENAMKYSPPNTTISITVIPYESFFCLQIEDAGIGIAEEEQGLIFSRFYRSKNVAKERGMGIGLYLAREIITKQGGYIKVHSKLGNGSRFSVYLPRYLS